MGRGQATIYDHFDAVFGSRRGGGRPDGPLGVDDWVLESALRGRGARGQKLTSLVADDPDTGGGTIVLLWEGDPFGWLSKQHTLYLIPKREMSQYDNSYALQGVCHHIEELVTSRGDPVNTSPLSTVLSHLRIAERSTKTP